MSFGYAMALGVALSLVGPMPVLADALGDGVAAIPGSVEDARIAGTWERDGKSGAYRIVIARSGGDSVSARMFVQWIAYHDDGEASVDNSIEIAELADLKLDIVDYTSESDVDGLSVYIQTLNPDGDGDENYELHIFSPTDYRFGPATN
jgi:hypothetical protein